MKRERRNQAGGKARKRVPEQTKPHVFLAFALPAGVGHEQLAQDVFTVFKFGFLENAATLAAALEDRYVLVLDFLSAEEAERCLANLRNNAPHLTSITPVPSSLPELKPWGVVLPPDISVAVTTLFAADSEVQTFYWKALVDRREKQGKGDYVVSDLTDEEYTTLKELKRLQKLQ